MNVQHFLTAPFSSRREEPGRIISVRILRLFYRRDEMKRSLSHYKMQIAVIIILTARVTPLLMSLGIVTKYERRDI